MKNREAVSTATTPHDFLEKNNSSLTNALFTRDAAFVPKNAKAIRHLDYPESKVGGGWRLLERFEPGGYLFGQFRRLEDDSDVFPLDKVILREEIRT
jgi:hypothetical protein